MNTCFLPPVWRDIQQIRSRAKVITCCFWRRPVYTQMVLDALRACHGIGDYLLLIQQDGADHRGDIGQSQVRKICERIDFADARIISEDQHLGCNQNTRKALAAGFRHSDYVIHVEDDILLSNDALKYFEWCRQFGSDPRLFIASAWGYPPAWKPSSSYAKPPTTDYDVSSSAWLWIWGFATWEDRWRDMDAGWTNCWNDRDESWDCVLNERVRGSRESLMPHTGRSYNIGDNDGTHRGAAKPEYWAGSTGFDNHGTFRRV